MENKNLIITAPENLLALSAIRKCIDDERFGQFYTDMVRLRERRDFYYLLGKISNGTFTFAPKEKQFYKEYIDIFELINKYSDTFTFLFSEERHPYMDFFLEYFTLHEYEMDKIIEVLNHIQKLKIHEIHFSEELDFTKEVCMLDSRFVVNQKISVFDHMQVIPSCYYDKISYKTVDSPYKIDVTVGFFAVSEYCRSIDLNTLVFDASRLPDTLSKNTTFDYIVSLKEALSTTTKYLRDAVSFAVGIDELESELLSLQSKLDSDVESQEELLGVLGSFNALLPQLKEACDKYHRSVMEENSSITPEVMEKEKQLLKSFNSSNHS